MSEGRKRGIIHRGSPGHRVGTEANTIGLANAKVGGYVEKVFSVDDVGREVALSNARAEATE